MERNPYSFFSNNWTTLKYKEKSLYYYCNNWISLSTEINLYICICLNFILLIKIVLIYINIFFLLIITNILKSCNKYEVGMGIFFKGMYEDEYYGVFPILTNCPSPMMYV